MISIIRATENDFKAIAEIGKVAIELAHRESSPAKDLGHYLETNYNYDAIKKELGDPENVYHLISYIGKPVGFSKIILNAEHPNIPQKNVTKLDRIYLLEEFFGLKLGYELLKYNIEFCTKNKQAGIWLFTWVGNTRAINFYLRTGFKIEGNHMFKVSETHSNPNHHMFLEIMT